MKKSYRSKFILGTAASLIVATQALGVVPAIATAAANEQVQGHNLAGRSWQANTSQDISAAFEQQTVAEDGLYTIQWGDTLSVISQVSGISVADLAQANGIVNPDLIIEGWIIVVDPQMVADLIANGEVFARNEANIDRSGENRVIVSGDNHTIYGQTVLEPSAQGFIQGQEQVNGLINSSSTNSDEDNAESEDKLESNHSKQSQPEQVEDEKNGQANDLEGSKEIVSEDLDTSNEDEKVTEEKVIEDEAPIEEDKHQDVDTPSEKPEDIPAGEEEVIEDKLVDEKKEEIPGAGGEKIPNDVPESEGSTSNDDLGTTVIQEGGEVVVEEASEEVDPETGEVIVKDPVVEQKDEISEHTYQTTVTINPGIQYQENPDLPAGEQRVISEGVPGSRTTTYVETLTNGVVTNTSVADVVEIPSQAKVIEVGTKQADVKTTKTRIETVKEDLGTEYVADNELTEDKQVVEEGSPRIIEKEYVDTYINDELVSSELIGETVIDSGQATVIRIGTKAPEAEVERTRKVVEETIETPNTDVEYRETDQLNKGEEEVLQEAKPKVETVQFEIIKENGVEIERNEVEGSRTVVEEGQPKIVVVGTKEESNTPTEEGKDQNVNNPLGATQGTPLGGMTEDEDTVSKWTGYEINVPYDNINDLRKGKTDEELYQLAKQNGSHVTNHLTGEMKFKNPAYGKWVYPTHTAIHFSQEFVNEWNKGSYIDENKLNQEFEYLINDLRGDLGLSPVKMNSAVAYGAEERAKEMADYGYLRYIDENGKEHSHTRLDGSPWVTVFYGKPENDIISGELLTQRGLGVNPYEAISEKYIAEELFTSWKNSPGHYAIMVEPKQKGFWLGVGMTKDDKLGASNAYIGALITTD